jgi:ParB family chromosome partitioning protein
MKAERVAVDLSGLDQFKASALLADAVVEADGVPRRVRLELIDFDPRQPRRNLNRATLAELAETIKAQGVLEPVSLRSHPERPGRYIINRGERRVRASLLAKLVDVPAFIDERVDPYAQVIENAHREDLSLYDFATFVAEREAAGESRAEIARRLGKPRSLITELAALGEASAELRQACESGRIADSRSLYLLARAQREQPGGVAALLGSEGAITRSAIERALAPSPPAAEPAGRKETGAAPQRGGGAREAPKKLGNALLVEHEGRKGRLTWARQPGKRSGEVLFEDGTRQTVSLHSLTLLAWTTR